MRGDAWRDVILFATYFCDAHAVFLLSPIPREQLAHDVEVVVRRRELAGMIYVAHGPRCSVRTRARVSFPFRNFPALQPRPPARHCSNYANGVPWHRRADHLPYLGAKVSDPDG